jgi:WD40 repeat protein
VEVGQTQTGAILGTPSFMAPEQASGKTKEIGPAADVYALGATLYELLTGRPQFKAATPLDTMLQVIGEEPVSPRALQPKVPRDLETVCLKCLEKEPNRRYATSEGLAADLGRFVDGEPVIARPITGMERGLRWARRHPTAAGLLAVSAVLVLLLVAGGVALSFDAQVRDLNDRLRGAQTEAQQEKGAAEEARGREEGQRKLAEEAQEEADQARRDEAELRARAERLFHFMSIERVHGAWRENDVRRAEDILARCDSTLRNWEWGYLWRLCHSDLRTFGHVNSDQIVSFSPDGMRLASAEAGPSGPSKPVVVKVWDTAQGRELLSIQWHTGLVSSLCFSPDGKRLAGSAGNTLKIWDAERGQELLTLKGHTRQVFSMCFSPDGKRLASGSQDRTVTVWDPEGGQALLTLKGHTSWVSSVCFSPDGKRLASGSWDRMVKVWGVEHGQELLTLKGHTDNVGSVCFSRDSKRLASASSDGTVKVWDVEREQDLLTLNGHSGEVNNFRSVRFSADGKCLAGASEYGTVKVWDAEGSQELLTLKGHTNTVYSVCFSPDGRRLASASSDGTVRLWPGRPLAPLGLGPAHLILQTLAARGLAAAGPPTGGPAQDAAALGLIDSDAFLLAANQERPTPSKGPQP